jgi:hypothetical protein
MVCALFSFVKNCGSYFIFMNSCQDFFDQPLGRLGGGGTDEEGSH